MMHRALNTGVAILQKIRVAAATFVTMEEILRSSNSANPTAITMILFLRCIIIKQLASLTEVLSHAHTTVDTNLLNLLFSATKRAYHLFDFMAWHVMSMLLINIDIVLHLIMTMTAIKYFVTARCSDAAPSPIVQASIFH